MSGEAVLRAAGLSKTYPGTRALRSVDVQVTRGSIHAVVGANGSGKSTLVKLLAGVERADRGGTLAMGGQTVAAERLTPEMARSLGLRFVHQEIGVFDYLSVAENVAMAAGFETTRAGRIRWRELDRRTRQLIERYEIEATPDTLVAALRPASRMMLAIARALGTDGAAGARLLVLDEPTAALPQREAQLLAVRLRRFAQQGQSIIFISHDPGEVLRLADQVTVLRDGAVAAVGQSAELTEDSLVSLICGRELERVFPPPAAESGGEEVLRADGLCVGPLKDVGFSVRSGEIVGIAGLLGSGRTTLLRALFGDVLLEGGSVRYRDSPARIGSPTDAIRLGIGYVPEDRQREAALADLSIRENVVVASLTEFWRRARMAMRAEAAETRRQIDRFSIQASGPAQPLAALSGGNQQKVVLARWLRRRPWLLLLDEPSQGVDVGARADIYAALRKAADEGAAVLIVASDFEELASACDRVLVLRAGTVTAEFRAPVDVDELSARAYQDSKKVAL